MSVHAHVHRNVKEIPKEFPVTCKHNWLYTVAVVTDSIVCIMAAIGAVVTLTHSRYYNRALGWRAFRYRSL